MGQKVNPHGLRVGVIKDWDSRWYAKNELVGDLLVEDKKIRDYLKKTLYGAGIPKIEIERDNAKVRVYLHCARPGVVIGKGGEEIKAIERADWRMDEPGISPDEMQSRDFEFHNALAMASGNSILTELIKAIRKVIAGKLEDSTEALPISGEGSLLHKKIIRAVKERNLEEALEAMEEYLIITDYKA